MDESQEPFIFLRSPQKFERDPARAHRPNHRGDFKRSVIILQRDLQIKDIVEMHRSLALDNAPAHRDIQDCSLPPHFASGEGQEQTDGNPQVFTPIHHSGRITASQARGWESETAGLTVEWRNAGE